MHSGALDKFKATIAKVAELIETRSAVEVDWHKDVFIAALPLAYVLRGECLEVYRRLVLGLLDQPDWRSRFSEKYIQLGVQGVLRKALAESRQADLGEDLEAFVLQAEAFNIEQRVFLPIQLLGLKVPQVQIGRIILKPATEELLTEILKNTETRRERVFSKEFSWTLAEYCVVAEPVRAIERAEAAVRSAMDILNYAFSFLMRPGVYAPVDLQGDAPTGDRGAVVRSTGDKWRVSGGTDGSLPVDLTDDNLKRLEPSGLWELSKLLCSDKRSEFENALLSSIHWFATAQQQQERPNRVLALTTALETMLTSGSDRISTGVAEGVAFVLEKDFESRKRVKKQVSQLYRLRSGISHGGEPKVAFDDLQRLVLLTRDFLYQMTWSTGIFNTKKDLADWIEEQRLS